MAHYTPCPIHPNSQSEMVVKRSRDQFWGLGGHFSYRKCRECDSWILQNPPHGPDMGHYYSEYYGDAELNARRAEFQRATKEPILGIDGVRAQQVIRQLDLLEGAISERSQILDVGCGAGGFLRGLMHFRQAQVRGLDFNERCRDFVQSVHQIPVDLGELKGQNYSSGQFDVVTAWHCLEHTYDPRAELDEMYRILRPEGWLVLEVPTPSLLARLFKGRWVFLQPPTHLYHLSQKALVSMVESAGFKIGRVSRPWLPTEFAGSVLLSLGMNRFAQRILFEGGRWSNYAWRALLISLMPIDLCITAVQWAFGSSGVIRIFAKRGEKS